MLRTREGAILVAAPVADGTDLGDRDLRRADFRGIVVAALELDGADLRGADFTDSELYWPNMYFADCSDASFRNALLEGVNFKSACFRRADFSGAKITSDQLGRASSLAHADLSEALLNEAEMSGTLYFPKTIWPENFDPSQHGLVLKEYDEDWLVDPICR